MSVTLWGLVLTCVSAGIGLLSSTLHFALRDFSLRKLEEIAGRNGGVEKLRPIIDDSESYALSMGALRSLAVAAMVVGITLIFPVRDVSQEMAIGSIAIALVISAALMYVLAVLVPASTADHFGEALIHRLSWLIRVTHWAFFPLRGLLVIDTVLRYLAGTHRVTEQEELEDELLSVATEGEREGNLSESERKMIEAVLDLRSRTTQEIMTPRTEMEAVPVESSLDDVLAFIEEAGHSRIPVYEGDTDHITGVLYAKDLLRFVRGDAGGFELRTLARPALFVPENKPANELLIELQSQKVHLAIVLDEYGGTTGLVTLEDILEEIVGEIRDEYEPEDEQPPSIDVDAGTRTAELEARAYIHEANRALEVLDIQLPESDHYDTVGGYVLSHLGHIPVAGETFGQNGFVVTVTEAELTRVQKLRIELSESSEHSESAAEVPEAVEAGGSNEADVTDPPGS